MNENAKLWIKELRSGNWKQARGMLAGGTQFPESYCCLGVACELHRRATQQDSSFPMRWEEAQVCSEPYSREFCYGGGVAGILPPSVAKWLGLKSRSGDYIAQEGLTDLAKVNDNGASFEQIADIIESEPENLFYE